MWTKQGNHWSKTKEKQADSLGHKAMSKAWERQLSRWEVKPLAPLTWPSAQGWLS